MPLDMVSMAIYVTLEGKIPRTPTESYSQFAVRISEMLRDPQKFEELLPYLKKVGFNTK